MRKHLIHSIVILSILLGAQQLQAQAFKVKVDSLYNLYTKETVDTNKVILLVKICSAYEASPQRVKGVSFAREALELSERIKFDRGICLASIKIGSYYTDQLNYAGAIEIYFKAIKAAENRKMYPELSRIYNAIGIMYSNQGRNEECLKYFLMLAKIAEEHKMDQRLAVAYNNIGIAYKDLGRFTEAKNYYEKAKAQFIKTDYKYGIASVANNLGIVSHALHKDEEALAYYDVAIKNFHLVNDTMSEAGIYVNIGELYNDNNEYQKALGYYLKGLEKAKTYKHSNFTNDAYDGLSKVYANMHDYEKAYFYNQKHLALKDSINNEEGMRKVQEMEKRLDNEKQEKEIQLLKQGKELQDLKVKNQSEKIKQNTYVIYGVVVVLVLVLSLLFFIFKAYQQIKKTNLELAEKKKEIQDSINYAKNIQEAMLPDVSMLHNYFLEGFGLFLPKDVVSGDFYWFSELQDKIYFSVADCTGHGVPGGFMSMIGIEKLNQGLIDEKIEQPSALLSFLNRSIKRALKQSTESSLSRDGMDIALCCYNKNSLELLYAGANRPLWVIRNNEVLEYKATKTSIAGFTSDHQVFDAQIIQLQKDDVIYLFSDGYADQFGGPAKKKFMTKQLKQLMVELHKQPMAEQERFFLKRFNEWRGNLEQVDDVLLFGVRI